MHQTRLLIILFIFFSSTVVHAQSRQITGKIINQDDGSSILGASILLEGSAISTSSASDGSFSIQAASGQFLIISGIGYIRQRIPILDQSSIEVALQRSTTVLEDVVITGYSVTRKAEFSGAASQVSGAEIAEMPIQSFGQGLMGKAPGVHIIQPNGVLNNPPVIRVRGLSSISLSSFPLVVVDGIPISTDDVSNNAAANNPLADINPSDIESIDILKDAASASIYGSRAAAGVLVITTKRGKIGETRFNYDGWVGISNAVRLPSLLNAQEYISLKNQAIQNALQINPNLNQNAYPSSGGFFPLFDAQDNLVDTRWYDETYRTGVSQNHNLSISGGNEKTVYYFSVGLSDQDGFIIGNNFKRRSGRFNIDHKLTNWFKFTSNITYNNSINNSPNTGSLEGAAYNASGLARIALVQAPNVSPRNPDGSYAINGNSIGAGNNFLQPNYNNPLPLIDLNTNESITNRLFANLGAELNLLPGLTFRTSFTWDLRNTENKSYWNPIQGDGFAFNGQARNHLQTADNWNFINTLQYNKSYKNHHFSWLIGNDAQRTFRPSWGNIRRDAVDDFFDNYQGTYLVNLFEPTDNLLDEVAYEAYLSSFNYNYAGKYFFSANFRRDGNSALSPNNRWGNFGGVSGAWNIQEENFFKNTNLARYISQAKLKGSWGRVGNGNLSNIYGAYNTVGAGLYGNEPMLIYNQAGNEDLKWETSSQTNIGIDIGVLNNRLNFEVNWYNKNIDNMILEVQQAPSKGIPGRTDALRNRILMNVGSMYNRGFEFSVQGVFVEKPNFKWTSSLNFATNTNLVTSLVDDNTPILGYTSTLELTSITQVGASASSIYAVRTAGVNPENGRRIFINAAGELVQYLHLNGDETWTYLDGSIASSVAADAEIIGNTLPTWFGGFNNTFVYKNVDLSLNFVYSGGNLIYNGSRATLRDQRIWNNSKDMLDAWSPTHTDSQIPWPVYGDNVSNGSAFVISDNVEKGDFLRLQTINLGYTLPTTYLTKYGLTSLRLYTAVNNAFVLTKYTGVDPEISSNGDSNISSGIERNSVPQGRTFTFGVHIGF